jgi:hypothetical protein
VDLLAVYYMTVATAQIMSTAVVVVVDLTTIVAVWEVHPVAVVVQDSPLLVLQILVDLIQTPFTDLEEMAVEVKLELHTL